MPRFRPDHPRRLARRGSIYLPTLLIGSIIAALAIGGLVATRTAARSSALRSDLAEARSAAFSGIDAVRAYVRSDPAWRTNRSNGTWWSDFAYSSGGPTFTVSVVNPAGSLARTTEDPVHVSSVGTDGKSKTTLTATLGPINIRPLSCLNAAVGAASGVFFSSAKVVGTGQLIATNGSMNTSLLGNTIQPNVEASLTVLGLGYLGTVSSLSPADTYPDATVFDYYTAVGVPINYTALSSGSSGRELRRIVLSPTFNPWGAASPQGIYVINCQGGALTISSSRIVGTLVVLNASSVVLENSVHWEPASSALPALLVRGGLTWRTTSTALREADHGVNFNPSAAPFPYSSLAGDLDTTDQYPSVINGLVYASGNIDFSQTPVIHSAYAGGSITFSGDVTINYPNDRNLTTPPPGFRTFDIGLIPGSYR